MDFSLNAAYRMAEAGTACLCHHVKTKTNGGHMRERWLFLLRVYTVSHTVKTLEIFSMQKTTLVLVGFSDPCKYSSAVRLVKFTSLSPLIAKLS